MRMTNIARRWCLTSVAIFSALMPLGSAAGAAGRPAPALAGFQAFLFNSVTGSLSKNVIGSESELGNVPASGFASVSTLIVVRIAFGRDASVPAHTTVRLIATEGGTPGRKAAAKVVLDRTARLGPVGPDGTTNVGFWLDDTGCKPISLRALLSSGRVVSTKESVLPFSCYE